MSLPNLSLLDVCLGHLINHPEIDRSRLPIELHDHLEARQKDPYYRVNPQCNCEIWRHLVDNFKSLVTQFDEFREKKKKVHHMVTIFQYLVEHRILLLYYPKLARAFQDKLYEIQTETHDDHLTLGISPDVWSNFHHTFFGIPILKLPTTPLIL
jgi:hypothetical protein